MEEKGFQRARRPDQIAARRATILKAAAELFDAEGPNGTGLNAIAARAGFTKSNVYRYFESREEVLLSLYLDEVTATTDAMEARFARCPAGDLDALAMAISEEFLGRPRLCHLLSILSSTLEQNVSEDVIIQLKRAARTLTTRLAMALHRIMPNVPVEDCAWTWMMLAIFIVGLWPAAHPPASVADVLATEEFCDMKLVAERDVRRGVLQILRGAASEKK